MALHKVSKGLDIPLAGAPEQTVHAAAPVGRVALMVRDHVGLKARVLVEPGQPVRLGQPLLAHRLHAEVQFTAPASGRVEAVYRGEKRALQSVVVAVEGGGDEPHPFAAWRPGADAHRDSARALLLESGLWVAFRTRPFSRVPAPDAVPHAIFVTAMDTQPHAPDLAVALRGREGDVERGLRVLTRLTDGPVYLCRAAGATLGGAQGAIPRVQVEEFTGRHPAGTVGYHIHVLDPVHREKTVWHLGAQDVARIGHLFATGRLDPAVVVSLAGPQVLRPRLLRTRLGAAVPELVAGELREGPSRVISGSVLHGDVAADAVHGFLGRFHQQVSAVAERPVREFLAWMGPGTRAYSALPVFVSALARGRRVALDTRLHGSRRAMVPIGAYERVMPMDLMPTHLLRALTVGDVEWAEQLGALELDEEDLALCTFVCPGKYDYGPALRRTLSALAAEQ